jgi:GntR family transcriptional regulator
MADRPVEDAATLALRSLIASVGHTNDDRLPPERALAQTLGVSRGRIRRLLQNLAEEGLVVAKAQSAWRVSGQTISEPSQTLVGFSEMAAMYGYAAHSEVLSATTRLANGNEPRQLRLNELDRVYELVRRRYLDSRPVSVENIVIPLELAGNIPLLDFTDRSLFNELAVNGVDVRRTDAVVEAIEAPAHVAALLNLDVGAPILFQQEAGFDSYGRPLFLGHAHYRGDSYRFRSTLWRKPATNPTTSKREDEGTWRSSEGTRRAPSRDGTVSAPAP